MTTKPCCEKCEGKRFTQVCRHIGCSCHQEPMENYERDHSHTHCPDTNSPCGQKGKHRCCLCEKPVEEKCVCEEPWTKGVVHRTDGPCYWPPREKPTVSDRYEDGYDNGFDQGQAAKTEEIVALIEGMKRTDDVQMNADHVWDEALDTLKAKISSVDN